MERHCMEHLALGIETLSNSSLKGGQGLTSWVRLPGFCGTKFALKPLLESGNMAQHCKRQVVTDIEISSNSFLNTVQIQISKVSCVF